MQHEFLVIIRGMGCFTIFTFIFLFKKTGCANSLLAREWVMSVLFGRLMRHHLMPKYIISFVFWSVVVFSSSWYGTWHRMVVKLSSMVAFSFLLFSLHPDKVHKCPFCFCLFNFNLISFDFLFYFYPFYKKFVYFQFSLSIIISHFFNLVLILLIFNLFVKPFC